MTTVSENVPFMGLCHLCEKICKKSGREKQKPLHDFIEKWRDFHNKLHKGNSNISDSFFPALRLILPQCERDRAPYGIKETVLAKLYIRIFCLDKNSPDAQKLLNYRSPLKAKSEAGDFASVAYFLLKKRCPEKGTLNIHDINTHLDNISTCNATKDRTGLESSLMFLLRNTTALEQKWLIRMILKDMKLGMTENSVLKAFHVDGMDLYNVTNSLEKVCLRLNDPNVRLHEIEISLFAPFRPMLGEQAHPPEVEKIMKGEPFVIEVKYDGERVQLHKQGTTFKYFSRNGHEVSHIYGANALEGNLTPQISKSFKSTVDSCILDGEMVIYSNKMKCIVSKGENPDFQALQPDGDCSPCYCVFDILLLNNRVLSNAPLSERVEHIRDTLNPIPGKIQLTDQKQASTNADVADALNWAIDSRQEGIVIKSLSSTYRPNARKNGGWLKVKPDYIDNLMDEQDLLIIGGYYGEGRRGNKISHFLLGLAESPGDQSKKMFSVAKVGSGYSDKELNQLLEKLESHWKTYDPKKQLPHIVIGGGHKERPDVWIEPSNSCVVQVRAAEIVRSDKFAVNFTLRFPRVQRIRYDKPWHQCMTVQEFHEMRNKSEGRLANSYQLTATDEPSPKKARRMQPTRVISVAPHFRPTNIDDVEHVSSMLHDKEFCVIVTSLPLKQQLETMIAQRGGKLVQNPGMATFCVLVDKLTSKVSNIINTNQYNVVKSDWLNCCIEQERLLPWTPDDMLHCTQDVQEKLSLEYDEFGDSYTDEVTAEDLEKMFKNIPDEAWTTKCLKPLDIADLEFRYFSDSSLHGLFRTCWVYLDQSSSAPNNPLKLVEFKLRLYGANIASEINNQTTHLVLHSKDTSHLEDFQKKSRTRATGRFHIVTEKWVEKSIKHKNLLQEKEFMPMP